MVQFNYLDYKNRIPLEKCIEGDIPKINPFSLKYKQYWATAKRKMFEGYWVDHEGEFKWIPPALALYVNYWVIEIKKKNSKSKTKVLGQPRLRDIEWIKGYVHATARGFSGFEYDTKFSCHRVLLSPNKDEEVNYLDEHVRESLMMPDGVTFKQYKDSLEYLYEYQTEYLGRPYFYNTSLNVIDIECRNIGKSFISGCFTAHNWLTDGSMDYDEYREMIVEEVPPRSETLIGAIDSKYSKGLINKMFTGLNNLPGAITVGDTLYPSPIGKKFTGSLESGKTMHSLYDKKIGNQWTKAGSGSMVHHRTFMDNEFAANGTRPGFSTIDEVGFMSNLEPVLGQMAECTTVDGYKFGTIWMTGTGGDMEGGSTESVKRVFYSPKAYECLEFDDVFENKGKIGFFVPAWMALDEFRDELGNVDKDKALKKLLKERQDKANGKTKKALYDLLQMKPLVPSEAFLVLTGNIFPVAELKDHLSFIESHKEYDNLGDKGRFGRDENGNVEWKPDQTLHEADYPVIPDQEEGCVVIFEHPLDKDYGLYIAGIDPYDQDKAENSPSLGSCIVYKRFKNADSTYHLPVAEYTGRPDSANEFYEGVRRLLEYYNAKALYENEKTGIKSYFETKNCLYLLHKQPQIIKSISPNSTVNRNFGIHMSKQIKSEGEIYVRDWLKREDSPGVMNLTKIYSKPLLREMIAYNDEGNFDRVIAFMLCVLQNLEMHNIVVEEAQENDVDKFFDKRLFL
jgi:hypothetical protein